MACNVVCATCRRCSEYVQRSVIFLEMSVVSQCSLSGRIRSFVGNEFFKRELVDNLLAWHDAKFRRLGSCEARMARNDSVNVLLLSVCGRRRP